MAAAAQQVQAPDSPLSRMVNGLSSRQGAGHGGVAMSPAPTSPHDLDSDDSGDIHGGAMGGVGLLNKMKNGKSNSGRMVSSSSSSKLNKDLNSPGANADVSPREIWYNAGICAASSAAEPLMGLVDSFFVGGLGVGPVAALGTNTVIFNLISFFASCSLATTTTDRLATARAQHNNAAALSALAVALRIAVISGVVIAIVLLAAPTSLLRAAGTNDEIEDDARAFMAVRLLAIPAGMVLVVAEGAYRALLELRVPFICIAGLNAANAVLNPLLIYRANLGVRGSALATTLAQWGGAAAFTHYLLRDGAKFGMPRGPGGAMAQIKTLLFGRVVLAGDLGDTIRQCLLFLMRASFINIVYTVAGTCANKLGTPAAAGHQVLRQVCTLTICATWAFQAVGQSVVANAYSAGAEGRARARRSAHMVVRYGSVTAVALAVASYVGRDVWPAWFLPSQAGGDDAAAAALNEARGAIFPLALFIAASANNAYEGVLLGAGDVRFCAMCFAPACGACLATLVFLLRWSSTTPSLSAVWTGLVAYYATLLLLFAMRFHLRFMRGPLLVGVAAPGPGGKLFSASQNKQQRDKQDAAV